MIRMNKQTLNQGSPKKPFWKRNAGKLPGRSLSTSPAVMQDTGSLPVNPARKLTFEEFENHTEDAWDATDDDLLRNALAKIKFESSYDQVHATAQAVINHHSQTASSVTSQPQSHQGSAHSNASTNSIEMKQSTPSSNLVPKKFPGGAARTTALTSQEAIVTPTSIPDITAAKHSDTSSSTHVALTDTNQKHSSNDSPQIKAKVSLLPPDPGKAGSAPKAQTIRMPIQPMDKHKEKSRIEKFEALINANSTDLDNLRKLSWSGIPSPVRAVTWQLLSGYLPANKDRRESVLSRKRNEYFNFVKQFYEAREQPQHQTTYHQIHIDIPRTNPLIPLFQQPRVQTIFERLLFVWAVRHPASGYVQGINDLVTPFFVVFLTAQIDEKCDVETYNVEQLSENILRNMEADTFWCMSKLLDGIQDNYTFAQPGVQKRVSQLKELTKRVDDKLHAHLETEQIEYLQFAFRWMNNLLMREIPLRCTIRLWDTYLAETDGFSDFHLYVCAAFLKQWRNQLLNEKDFQGLMLMIQNVPTHHWGEEEIKVLLAEAFRLKYMFADAPSHLPTKR